MTAIEDVNEKIDFNLYPNPAKHFVTLEFKSPQTRDVMAELLTIDGKVLLQIDTSSLRSGITELDISQYPAGLYLVRMNDGVNQITKKLVVAR